MTTKSKIIPVMLLCCCSKPHTHRFVFASPEVVQAPAVLHVHQICTPDRYGNLECKERQKQVSEQGIRQSTPK